jgi:SMC interacting uncharacterized protein involved in chromosome segregation
MPKKRKYDHEQIKEIIRNNRGLKRYQLAQMCGCGANTIRSCIAEMIGERNKQYFDELERAQAELEQYKKMDWACTERECIEINKLRAEIEQLKAEACTMKENWCQQNIEIYATQNQLLRQRFLQIEKVIMHKLCETGEELKASWHDRLGGYYDGLKFAIDTFRRFE